MAVIFDMDGVISNTQKVHSRIESEMFADRGITISPEELTRRFSGVSGHDMFPAVFEEAGCICPDVTLMAHEKAMRFIACADEFEEIPGTSEVIRRLRHFGSPLAVASASRLAAIDCVLTKLKLKGCFNAIASSQEVARGKPAPDVFLLAAKRLNVAPAACTVVEDGLSGMLAARAAGMRCIALVPEPRPDLPADIAVDDLRKVNVPWFM